MARNEKRRQRSLQQRAAKRRQKQRSVSRSAPTWGTGRALFGQAANWRLHECLITEDWDEEGGLTQVIVARVGSEGEVAAACFLIDLGCLGVKNALYDVFPSIADYQELLVSQVGSTQTLVSADLNLVAKVIREGIDYARRLGFSPQRDYRRAALLLEGANPDACDLPIPLGRDGKPYYVTGPYDNARKIVNQLVRAVGEGNFHYLVVLDSEDELPQPLLDALDSADPTFIELIDSDDLDDE